MSHIIKWIINAKFLFTNIIPSYDIKLYFSVGENQEPEGERKICRRK